MNTLSSILQWIGNFIGSNPSENLTTTAKTIVGALNELKSGITQATQRISSMETAISKVQKIKFVTVDSLKIDIEGNSTGTFGTTYTVGNGYSAYLVGMTLRATGTNYSRVFLYGGQASLDGTTPFGSKTYELACYGRNTGSSDAANLYVRFRLLLIKGEAE